MKKITTETGLVASLAVAGEDMFLGDMVFLCNGRAYLKRNMMGRPWDTVRLDLVAVSNAKKNNPVYVADPDQAFDIEDKPCQKI